MQVKDRIDRHLLELLVRRLPLLKGLLELLRLRKRRKATKSTSLNNLVRDMRKYKIMEYKDCLLIFEPPRPIKPAVKVLLKRLSRKQFSGGLIKSNEIFGNNAIVLSRLGICDYDQAKRKLYWHIDVFDLLKLQDGEINFIQLKGNSRLLTLLAVAEESISAARDILKKPILTKGTQNNLVPGELDPPEVEELLRAIDSIIKKHSA